MDTPRFYDNGPAPEKTFAVEEFLDFSNDDDVAPHFDVITPDSVLDNNSLYDPNFIPDVSAHHAHFPTDLCVPYDDIAEMEWLSRIHEDSFSSEDLQRLQLISGVNARSVEPTNLDDSSETANVARMNSLLQSPDHDHEHDHDQHVATSVPGKARSKRSRAPPCNWSSRLLLVSASSSETGSSSPEVSEASAPPPPPMAGKKGPKKKEAAGEGAGGGGEGRRCVHCATDKTPQWRTGPMGPKTLCNACGVRYKSGRLVPEYRPAASPTFVLTKHSNSHRKVLELRRQKDFVRAHHHHQFIPNNSGFDHRRHASAAGEQEYLIHHHTGPDYRQIIYD